MITKLTKIWESQKRVITKMQRHPVKVGKRNLKLKYMSLYRNYAHYWEQ